MSRSATNLVSSSFDFFLSHTFLSSIFRLRPKVLIISLFVLEANVWLDHYQPSLQAHAIDVPGLSPMFPSVQCTANGDVCQATLGEGEINAAASMSALLFSDAFDLRKTYFIVAGVGGISPHRGTLGTAAFARYTVQVLQQYALDRKDTPKNWTSTLWNYGTTMPGIYPLSTYGTEAFKLNTALAERAYNISKIQTAGRLNDSQPAQAFRSRYDYAPANQKPAVILGDVTTSDTFFAGATLATQIEDTVSVLTNGSSTYTLTAQEDNAILEALVRAQIAGRADYSRAIILRTGSDFDRAPPGLSEYDSFSYAQGGFEPALANLFIAGSPVVDAILKDWKEYRRGIAHPPGFYGDIWQTLSLGPGRKPAV
ncbi:hypothetical protein OC845_003769 [Tilletia horrida]|nr:hypothetical protein OC845_003769 [Tilletia horrida]